MAICGTMSLQGSPIYWVAVHRMHHQYTDKPGDPHSPRDGKWWSHMGWILRGSLHSETTMLSRYAPDLQGDRFYQWLAVWHWLPITLTGIALLYGGAALGGWKLGLSWLLWGVFLRIPSASMSLGWSTRLLTCGVRAVLKLVMIPQITGGLHS